MSPRHIPGLQRRGRRPGTVRTAFSLVELLTVVGIIALLISILLPSMAGARREAKRAATKAFLGSCERGLEMFNTDFGQYPNSERRVDPITKWPDPDGSGPLDAPKDLSKLSGAHWLARAMVGHDGLGLDYNARTFGTDAYEWNRFNVDASNGRPLGDMKKRRGTYVEKALFKEDRTLNATSSAAIGPRTGRNVLLDSFEYPIIYYRANARAEYGFALDTKVVQGVNTPGDAGDPPGVYTHEDNVDITGISTDGGWDFANAGFHAIGDFGSTVASSWRVKANSPRQGFTFTAALHDPSVLKTAKSIKPLKATSFVLMSAGPDGLFGTQDDVSNFK